ncbi:type II toxin-antitoxin system RelE/ParE family toxin [bacterium]|nr:type II toxin-antitoxin system RelE/ParE family toxin [bacterium]
MIKSFRNKNLQNFYTNGSVEALKGIDRKKLKIILAQLDSADELRDLKIPSLQFQKTIKKGYYAIEIGKGKKLVFRLAPSSQK